ncbi:hypothetical protein HL653_00400 [Sphingomonas sp. AP4-R1]|uniref:hypothetical protein n=1 Tax=Sphingomonas sp. AP4-R1 TaxID=2735134 RepID=UPI0014935EC0|nr:hypothetical protein [Sphingomonas sp. AP4-R1]QJU56447.1 hypothetical protein HL653_00400 [Sphingomonas sp. AP4-R1]
MRRASLLVAALMAGAAGPQVADAQVVTAGGSVTGRIGYGSNPYLSLNSPGDSGVAGGDLTAWVQRASENSTTRLTGSADIDQNFNYYGRAENYLARLEHQQTISERLAVTARLRYQDSINPRNFFDNTNSSNIDLLSIGQRSRTFGANANLQWTPSARDSFYFGPQYSRSRYPNQPGNAFDQYGLQGGYLRQVTEKLKVGVDLSYQRLNSRAFSDSDSYQGGLRLVYDFSPIWQFDGGVGLIHQISRPGGSATTPGFNASLCGKYPRYSVCIEGSRQSAASGFGGLRTDNRIGAHGNYALTSRSSVNFSMLYDVSQSSGISTIPTQKFWEISGGYSRTLSERLSAGFSGRYQYRDYGSLVAAGGTSVTGFSGTFDVTYKFGRID